MHLYKTCPNFVPNKSLTMGRLPNGINGPIVGKVGTVIGSSRFGKPYVKGPYKKRTKKAKGGELGNRNKFGMSQKWLKPVLDFVREGFSMYKKTSGAFVAAKSNLLLNAFEGTVPDIRVNPALAKLSTGELPLPSGIVAEHEAPGQVKFSWDTAGIDYSLKYDQVMMLAYDIENRKAYYNITGQFRSTGSDTLMIDPTAGKTHHLYLAFTSADRSMQSDSVYLGAISN